jgi:hypothetical protein
MKLSHQSAGGVDFYRVNNDQNGNPRYVVHFLAFAPDYETAKKRANSIGFRVYRGRDFGGGVVGQSYSLPDTARRIAEQSAGGVA